MDKDSFELRRDADGEPIECDTCHNVVPVASFNVWATPASPHETLDIWQCDFCSSTHSNRIPVKEPTLGQSIIFHEVRMAREEIEELKRLLTEVRGLVRQR